MATKKPAAPANPDAAAADPFSEKELTQAEGLLALFDARNADGTMKFADEDVRHFLPMLLLATGSVTPEMCTDEVLELLGEFSVKAGIKQGASPEERGKAINAYYEKNPPNPGLVDAVNKFMREQGIEAGGPGLPSAALAKALGAQTSHVPVGASPRPAGAVGGGILGRLNAGKALDDKKKK
jgi:hypothetical protein